MPIACHGVRPNGSARRRVPPFSALILICLTAQGGESCVFPPGGEGGEDDHASVLTLQEHFLYPLRKGEIPLKREGAVGELALPGTRLVAVGVEAAGEDEASGECPERITRVVAVMCTRIHAAGPGE